MRLPAFTLTGRFVQLVPLAREHAAGLLDAAQRDRRSYGYTVVPADLSSMQSYIDGILDEAAHDRMVPFAQRRLADGALVGCTRYMNLVWWAGRDTPVEVEVGGTWLAADAQRTPINTEAKLLLLGHAFDRWHVCRVAICTDARNAQSRAAIERLGATFEGVLRKHRPSAGDLGTPGTARDTAVYSIVDGEWPAVRDRLEARLTEP